MQQTNQEGKRVDTFLDHKVKDHERRIERLEEEMDTARALIAQQIKMSLSQEIDYSKTEEPKIIPPHERLRKPRRGAKDYASEWHTESEHLSHGENAYRKTHPKSD